MNGHTTQIDCRLHAPLLVCLFLWQFHSGMACAGPADFRTNFQPELTIWNGSNIGGCGYGQCISHAGNADPTPFAESIVTINNTPYFHTIVGDPAAGFAIESYTRAAPGPYGGPGDGTFFGNTIPNQGGAFSPDGGGNLRAVIGDSGTAQSLLPDALNSANPLGDYRVSGTGGNDPRHTVFRMVMTSPRGDMSLEVSKPFLDKKPLISQMIQDGTMKSAFVADERALNYNQDGTAAPIINTLVITDPATPGAGVADFSMAQAQDSVVTAGRFTFTPGAGWDNAAHDPSLGWDTAGSTFDFGTYSYSGGTGFQPLTFDWATDFDYSQNAEACSAPSPHSGFTRDQSGSFGGSCFNKP